MSNVIGIGSSKKRKRRKDTSIEVSGVQENSAVSDRAAGAENTAIHTEKCQADKCLLEFAGEIDKQIDLAEKRNRKRRSVGRRATDFLAQAAAAGATVIQATTNGIVFNVVRQNAKITITNDGIIVA